MKNQGILIPFLLLINQGGRERERGDSAADVVDMEYARNNSVHGKPMRRLGFVY